ncbi:MAG: UDP-N-acetylglucosamine 2-epimerase (non-hydrolyzing) [Cryomorphaceae bacterium]|nr:UDP-N-acetylglucosamine 2-epimerase (non-hydrolyzing) [Cryomorphaceae bacterium]
MKIISVVGARPNFMKIAPFCHAISAYNILNPERKVSHILVHTGQHYDYRMSQSFFDLLNIPAPDINLEIGSGSHAEQVGQTMIAFEKVLEKELPDWVVVLGDVNATLACSVAAKKLHIKVCHIEAGLRSFDDRMPEEINRLVTDRLSDLLLVPDVLSEKNLLAEGVANHKIGFVGNIMVDTLEANRQKASELNVYNVVSENKRPECESVFTQDGLRSGYTFLTMHRPSNVDEKAILTGIIDWLLQRAGSPVPILWTLHPRTEKFLKQYDLWKKVCAAKNLVLMQPLSYHELLAINMHAKVAVTDSGGLQEECSILGTPFVTLRENTERPVTLREHGGCGVLAGNDPSRIEAAYADALDAGRSPVRPPKWDGKTAERCLAAILNFGQ